MIGLTQAGKIIAQSPWLGFKGGISIPDLSGGGGNPISENYTSRLAANFGLFSDFHVVHNFSIQVELNYAGQGGQRNGMQPITSGDLTQGLPAGTYLWADFKNKAVFNYLELPVLARLHWGRTFGFYANLGPYLGYLLHAEEKTRGSSAIYYDQAGTEPVLEPGSSMPAESQDFTSNTDITSSLHRFNVGVTGGGGIDWKLNDKNKLLFDARFEYGFVNIQKYSEDGKNNTGNVLISVGYAHRIGR
jgi:hypothetical protein